jgi:ornithine--oxo-acid transaminase
MNARLATHIESTDAQHPLIALDHEVAAQNYAPLPIVAERAEGAYIWDTAGRRYLDMMAAYSAVSFGHGHPRLVGALVDQARKLAITSRAMHSDQLAPFLAELTRVTGLPKALPMNTGAEAVETAIKAARKWAHKIKGVADGAQEIIVFDNNFHGRTTTVISFSSHPSYKAGFGPLTPGFKSVPFGDIEAVRASITPNTAAVLFEPIQGEGGVVVPPAGFLKALRALCTEQRVLMIADEIQTGMGRTGRNFGCEHEDVLPDAYCLGKTLGGGLLPVSAFVSTAEVMDLFVPGSHGSTFGGYPLAARVGLEALRVMQDEGLVERSERLGKLLRERLAAAKHPMITDIRGRGLMVGVQLHSSVDAHEFVEGLAEIGIITKDTHRNTVRLSPPLVIGERELEWAVERFLQLLDDMGGVAPTAKAA